MLRPFQASRTWDGMARRGMGGSWCGLGRRLKSAQRDAGRGTHKVGRPPSPTGGDAARGTLLQIDGVMTGEEQTPDAIYTARRERFAREAEALQVRWNRVAN